MKSSSSSNLARMIEASRRLQGPSDVDRVRVGSAIERRLVVGATAATIASTSKALAGSAGKGSLIGTLASSGAAKVMVVSAIVAASGIAGWKLVVSTRSVPVARTTVLHRSPGNANVDTRPAAPATAPSVEVSVPPEQVAPTPRPAHAASAIGSARPNSSPASMARELELVRSAQRSLESGDALDALAVLDRYQGEFPRGMLAQEAATVRILALCGAGRTVEGLALAQRFLSAQPGSPFARRVRSACGVAAPEPSGEP